MKQINKLFDEIPVTKEGLKIYIEQMNKVFKPVKLQYNRMSGLLEEAKNRLKLCGGSK